MADPVQSLGLRNVFGDKAATARRELSKELTQASAFMQDLEDSWSRGMPPTANDIKTGQHTLLTIDQQLEIAAYNEAIMAGQLADNEDDVVRKVADIERSLEQVQQTRDHLRQRFEKLGQ